MRPRLKFALVVGGLFLYVLAGLVALAAAVSSDLRSTEREVLERVLRREASLGVFIGVLFLLGLGFLVSLFFSRYVVAPRRLAREAQLIATANPSHRVEPERPAGAPRDRRGRQRARRALGGGSGGSARADRRGSGRP